MNLRLRASPRHGGQETFYFGFWTPIRRGGAPSGAAASIVPDESGINNSRIISKSNVFLRNRI